MNIEKLVSGKVVWMTIVFVIDDLYGTIYSNCSQFDIVLFWMDKNGDVDWL